MNFFKRAIKNVTRKLSKSILLAITFFVIGNFVIVGLSVANATESAKTLTRKKMRAVVNYEMDYQKYYKDAEAIEDEDERSEFYNNYPYINLADVQGVLKDDRVKTANCLTNGIYYMADGSINYVHIGNTVEESIDSDENKEHCFIDFETQEQKCYEYKDPIFFYKANDLPNMIEFVEGDYKIVEGEFYSQEDIDNMNEVVVISENLAKLNNLKVGDYISIQTDSYSEIYQEMGVTKEDFIKSLKIIGIYSHNQAITPDSPSFDYTYPYDNPDNMLLFPGTVAYKWELEREQIQWDYYASISDEGDDYYSNPDNRPSMDSTDKIRLYNVVFLLNDPLEVDSFVEEASTNVGAYKKLNANNKEFNKLAKPLDTLNDYAKFLIGLVVGNAIIIITLVTALTLKTREYEIGVLLSIGASKLKIILQFFIELAIVAIIGFTLSVGSGSLISR